MKIVLNTPCGTGCLISPSIERPNGRNVLFKLLSNVLRRRGPTQYLGGSGITGSQLITKELKKALWGKTVLEN